METTIEELCHRREIVVNRLGVYYAKLDKDQPLTPQEQNDLEYLSMRHTLLEDEIHAIHLRAQQIRVPFWKLLKRKK